MLKPRGNDLRLGQIVNSRRPLGLSAEQRCTHLYVVGSTGTGKSKFLESMLRQDIVAWQKSRCGLLLLDPHGNLYDSLLQWLAWHKLDRPVIPIDLRRDDCVIGYNVLQRRAESQASVVVHNMVEAIAHVWGQEGVAQTPQFAQWASNILHALYQGGHSLAESVHLMNHFEKTLRRALTAEISNPEIRRDWEAADALSLRDFEERIGSTVRRLRAFLENDLMKGMFGQTTASLDLRAALDEGQIVLVSLATAKGRVSPLDAKMFATLMLTDLWRAARERGKGDEVKPFYVYIDEFQEFITPTIAKNLDQARGFGLHLTMAHQFPGQLRGEGAVGERLFGSIMNNATNKVAFRVQHKDDLEPLAFWMFAGALNPDEIKHELYSTKVMGYRVEYEKGYSRSRTTSQGGSGTTSSSQTESAGGSSANSSGASRDENGEETGTSESESAAESWNRVYSETHGETASWSTSESEGESDTPMLKPIMGRELSSVQFRSLEEQLFRAMAVLFDQQQRQGVARLDGMSLPVSIFTPTVNRRPSSPEMVEKSARRFRERLPFAIPYAEAMRRIEERRAFLQGQFLDGRMARPDDEPHSAERELD